MGSSASKFPPHIVGIYKNVLAIKAPATRMQMIQTLLSSPEHSEAARAAGIYGHLLHYVQTVKEGRPAPVLPGEGSGNSQPLTPYGQSVGQQPFGQGQGQGQAQPQRQGQQLVAHKGSSVSGTTASQKGNEKAMNYFSACLRILQLEEEVALTNDALKAAYKKAVIRAHPDKGGSEKEFEAVTRAYAYLGDILKRINGGRATEGKVEAPAVLNTGRSGDAEAWKMVEPIQLNPSKLNLDAFNTMFEKTRIPDPEESGYGDWLKGSESAVAKTPTFGGKFNRDVFNKAFEDESRPLRAQGGNALVAQELSLARGMNYVTDLGRTAREDYTVAAVETGRGQGFTDLKKAYTEYNTFTHQTNNVQLPSGSIEQMVKDRKSAPAPLADAEMASLREAEAALARQEEMRKRRVAEEAVAENNYFERMKRLVIRNG
jgi:curved DNA-binding protein CbpA